MRHIQRSLTTTILFIIIITAAVALTSGYFIFSQNLKTTPKSINSFEACARLYPVMESYPEQCNTPDGKHFTKQY